MDNKKTTVKADVKPTEEVKENQTRDWPVEEKSKQKAPVHIKIKPGEKVDWDNLPPGSTVEEIRPQ